MLPCDCILKLLTLPKRKNIETTYSTPKKKNHNILFMIHVIATNYLF